jgi:hypothetical protein
MDPKKSVCELLASRISPIELLSYSQPEGRGQESNRITIVLDEKVFQTHESPPKQQILSPPTNSRYHSCELETRKLGLISSSMWSPKPQQTIQMLVEGSTNGSRKLSGWGRLKETASCFYGGAFPRSYARVRKVSGDFLPKHSIKDGRWTSLLYV